MPIVTLVRPPLVLPRDSHLANHGTPPLALAYLAGSLKARGHEVHCIDAFGERPNYFRSFGIDGLLINGLSTDEIVERVPAATDVLGVSCMYSNEWIYTREVIHRLRERFPEVALIAGGEHVTADAESLLNDCPEVAACVLGEGEETLVELLDAVAGGRDLAGVRGIALRGKDGRCVRTPARERIRAIDAIPWPSWDELPIETYLDLGLGFGRRGRRAMPVLASRGCPYQCTFCSSPQMWTTRWLSRDVDDLIDEIESYVGRYRIEHFDFYDLTAIVERQWILRFCQRLRERGVRLTWALPSGTRSEALSSDVLRRMREAGCAKVNYAPESGSEATLKRVKKQVRLDRMVASIRAAVKVGIVTRANLIVGLPGQTWRELLDDYLFAARLAVLGMHDLAAFAFVPYPGIELYRDLVAQGKIVRNDEHMLFLAFNVTNSPAHMRSWSESLRDRHMPWIILSLEAFFYGLQFLLRPWRLARLVHRMATRKPLTTIEIILSEMLLDWFTGRKRRGSLAGVAAAARAEPC